MIRTLFATGRRHTLLTLIAFGSASVSILALLLHAAGWLPMYFLVDVLAAPSLALLLALGVLARRLDQPVFLNRLAVGAWGGLVSATAVKVLKASG